MSAIWKVLPFGDTAGSDMGVLSPLSVGGTYGALHITTEDANALWERAVRAGAAVHQPLQEVFWGDRHGQVICPFGTGGVSGSTSATSRWRRSPGPRQRCSAARRADTSRELVDC